MVARQTGLNVTGLLLTRVRGAFFVSHILEILEKEREKESLKSRQSVLRFWSAAYSHRICWNQILWPSSAGQLLPTGLFTSLSTSLSTNLCVSFSMPTVHSVQFRPDECFISPFRFLLAARRYAGSPPDQLKCVSIICCGERHSVMQSRS